MRMLWVSAAFGCFDNIFGGRAIMQNSDLPSQPNPGGREDPWHGQWGLQQCSGALCQVAMAQAIAIQILAESA